MQPADAAGLDELAVERTLAQMSTTISALRVWRDAHAAATALELPARRSHRLHWFAGISAAAAVFVVAAILVVVIAQPRGDLPGNRSRAEEFSWTAFLPARDAAPTQSVAMRSEPWPERGTVAGGGPGGIDGASGLIGGQASNAGVLEVPALRAFQRQFSFTFNIPLDLPPDWAFIRGRAVSPTVVQLIYQADAHQLDVFLTADSGPDIPFKETLRDGASLVAGRRHHTAIAFRGGTASADMWTRIADQLTAQEKDKP